MATSYLATRISPHLARTPDGFLLAKDVLVARSGTLEYTAAELGVPGAGMITVHRPPQEVTDSRFLASCEGAVVCDAHPGRFVDPSNYQAFARGHAQNSRVGPRDADGNVQVLCDLFINDSGLADKVEAGIVRDVSIGFDLTLEQENGRYVQRNLRVNHIAVVARGRAGSTKILDAAPRFGLSDVAALYLGREPSAVTVPSHSTRATDSAEERTMPEEKEKSWTCPECRNVNHAEADDCAKCGRAYDDAEQEALIPAPEEKREEPDLRAQALQFLREIKPEILKGSDAAKRRWNDAWMAIKKGKDPRSALDGLRAHGKRQTADSVSDAQAFDFSDYLGRDVAEVTEEREQRVLRQRAEALRRAVFDARPGEQQQEAIAASFVAKAESAGRELRSRKY